MNGSWTLALPALLALVLLACGPAGVEAAECNWSNTDGGDFHTDDNWDTVAPVNDTDITTFGLPGNTYTVTFAEDTGETNDTLTVGSTNIVTFDLNGNTYALTGDVTVGDAGDGAELKITDGTLTCDNLRVDYHNERGMVSIENGGAVTCNAAYVGDWFQDTGTLNVGVVGTGSLYVDTGRLRIGGGDNPSFGDTGLMNVGAGGTVTCGEKASVGDGGILTLTSGSTMYLTPGTMDGVGVSGGDLAVVWNAGDQRNSGILRGSGALKRNGDAGTYTVRNAGVISPGNSIGTITIEDGNLECKISSGWGWYYGEIDFDFDSTSCDLIDLITAGCTADLGEDGFGDAAKDGAATLVYSTTIGSGETGQHDFLRADEIVDFDLVVSDNMDELMQDLGYTKGAASSASWYTYGVVDDADGGSFDVLRLTYAPEPATAGMVCLGGVLMLLRRRRK